MQGIVSFFDNLSTVEWLQLIYDIVTVAAVIVAFLTIRHNRRMTAANWLLTAHRGFHSDLNLYKVFSEIKEKTYNFDYDKDHGTDKERELVNFLDFVNSVRAALSRKIISHADLSKTTIGFALLEVRKCKPIIKYVTSMEEKDYRERQATEAKDYSERIAVKAWGFLFDDDHPRR